MRWISWSKVVALSLAVAGATFLAPGRAEQNATAFWPVWLAPVQAASAEEQQGQSRLLLEVARDQLIDERVKSLLGKVRTGLRDAAIAYDELAGSDRTVQARIRNATDVEKARAALAELLTPASVAEGKDPVNEVSFEEPEPGLFRYTLTDAGIDHRVGLAVDRSVDIIGRRVREFGLAGVLVQKEDADRIRVEFTGLHDPERLQAYVAQRAWLTLQWIDESMSIGEALTGQPPAGSSILYSIEQLPFLVEDDIILSGDNLVGTEASEDQYSGAVIIFRFDDEGRRLFGEATQQNVGRALAVVIDGRVMMAPIIREPILGGVGQISGNLTLESARELALLLRLALPAKLNLIEVRFTPA